MVMLFNPDDPHDGHAATAPGFTYRMIHLAPALVEELLGDSVAAGVSGRGTVSRRGSASGRAVGSGLPLFPTPVIDDPALAQHLRLLYTVLTGTSTPLEQHEHLTSTVALLRRHATPATAVRPAGPASPAANGLAAPASALIASRVRALLHDAYATPLTASDLAAAAGCSRYTATRAFGAAYGLAPSDYQRQLRLRAARTLLTGGTSPAEAAAAVGFADQAHLTRWFRRYYGVTPGVYRQAVGMR
jgi:AraC-like DNA-binding protein